MNTKIAALMAGLVILGGSGSANAWARFERPCTRLFGRNLPGCVIRRPLPPRPKCKIDWSKTGNPPKIRFKNTTGKRIGISWNGRVVKLSGRGSKTFKALTRVNKCKPEYYFPRFHLSDFPRGMIVPRIGMLPPDATSGSDFEFRFWSEGNTLMWDAFVK